jgi:pyrrolysine biosynthesis protein PylD
MTRLTPKMIEDVPLHVPDRDTVLRKILGFGLRDLAFYSLGIDPKMDVSKLTIGVVPVTSGEGVTQGFSLSVLAIVEHIGFHGFITKECDIAGLSEATRKGADIVMMADDKEFIALNLKEGRSADNTLATAMAYFTAFKMAMGGVNGKEVLLIGVGRIGLQVLDMLTREGARVTIIDKDDDRIAAVMRKFPGVVVGKDIETAVKEANAFINASPASIPGKWIKKGAVVSSPGMPYSFDREGEERIGKLIHDPLPTGVAVMAVWSASYSLLPESDHPRIQRFEGLYD